MAEPSTSVLPKPTPPTGGGRVADPGTWLMTRVIALLVTCLAVFLAVQWPSLLRNLHDALGIESLSPASSSSSSLSFNDIVNTASLTTVYTSMTATELAIQGKRTADAVTALTQPAFTQTPDEATASADLALRLSPSQRIGRDLILIKIAEDRPTRDRLLQALHGFSMYETRALEGVEKKRKAWAKVPRRGKDLAKSAGVDYIAKLQKVEGLIRRNAVLCRKAVAHGLSYYGVPQVELDHYTAIKAKEGKKAGSDHTAVTQGLKHYVRDWAVEGEGERGVTFRRILRTLEVLYPEKEKRGDVKILIPGCGLGGLVWEVAGLGFSVTGNEWSFYMNLLQHFVGSGPPMSLEEEEPSQHTLHPYVEWFSHQATTSNLTRPINFPYPGSPLSSLSTAQRITILEADFTQLPAFLSQISQSPSVTATYDAIITLFFIDTARNLLDYLDKIHAYLQPQTNSSSTKPYWINLGPLLYGTAPWVELSLKEVIDIVEGPQLGFKLHHLLGPLQDQEETEQIFEGDLGAVWRGDGDEVWDTLGTGKVVGVRAGYGIDERGLGRNEYLAQGWVGSLP